MRGEQLFRAKDNRVELIADLLPDGSPDSAFLDAMQSRQPTISPAEAALPLYDWTAAVWNRLAKDAGSRCRRGSSIERCAMLVSRRLRFDAIGRQAIPDWLQGQSKAPTVPPTRCTNGSGINAPDE